MLKVLDCEKPQPKNAPYGKIRSQFQRRTAMSESFYTVKPGDSLSKIAKEVWGDMRRWSEIFEAN